MNTPSRRPDFNAIFDSEDDFNAAIARVNDLSSIMLNHVERIGAERITSGNEIDGLAEVMNGNKAFSCSLNSRAISQNILVATNSKIVPAAHGRIENLLISVPWSSSQGQIVMEPLHARHYQSLVNGLGNNRHYTILCHPYHRQEIASWFSQLDGISMDFCLSPVFEYSIWAQDAYVALKSSLGQSILAEGVLFRRRHDMTIADDVATQSSTSVLQSTLYYQGGNVLGGPGYCLIGEDYIHRNQTRVGIETRQKVLDKFEQTFGQPIISLGGSRSACYELLRQRVFSGRGFQPLFHIDMYVTPTGVAGTSGKEIVFLGRPEMAKQITGRYSEENSHNNQAIDSFFDETESQLSQYFEIKHLPLMLTHGDLRSGDPHFYWITFNNVVLENTGTEKNVLMTTYSQDSGNYGTDPTLRSDLEDAAESIWQSIGYTVKRTDGLEDLAKKDGSIHCITKALDRAAINT